jgi:hypothetical protein
MQHGLYSSSMQQAVPYCPSSHQQGGSNMQLQDPRDPGSFHLCLDWDSFSSLVECSISNEYEVPRSSTPLLDRLPCPQLRQLQLENVRVQFEAAGSAIGSSRQGCCMAARV